MSQNYNGLGVAMVTPFDSSFRINYTQLTAIIDHLINNGVNYIVALGTTGESVTLTKQEKLDIIKASRDHINGRVPLVVGAGGNNTAAVIDTITVYNGIEGINAYLSVSPAYNKPSQAGIYAHYQAIANATERDIILYNVPGRTAKNMEVDTILKLAANFKNIVGVKEAGGNMVQSMLLAKSKPEGFSLISGDDDLALPQLACGFGGVISVIGNAYPKLFSDMIHLVSEGELLQARQLQYALLEIIQLIFAENNPAGIKSVMEAQNLLESNVRLPVVPVSTALDEHIKNWVNTFAYPV